MDKTIDKETLATLLAVSTKVEIAAQFGLTTKSVTRLIRQYGLPNPPYHQSDETKRRRAEAIRAAHRNDPGLTARKMKGVQKHLQKVTGKRWEEVYPPEQVAQMKEQRRQALLGKPARRKPRTEPKLCALCGALVAPGQGKRVQAYCKACVSEYFKAYYRQRQEHYKALNNKSRRHRIKQWREYLASVKSHPCLDCGKSFPAFCMDFDHLEAASKVAAIPELISRNAARARIEAELKKVELVCVNCHRAREYRRYLQSEKIPVPLSPRQRRHKELLAQLKSCPCPDCGGQFSVWQMDFDHVRGEKVQQVGCLAMSGSTEALLAEIDKCEIVCAVCHRIRTFSRKAEIG